MSLRSADFTGEWDYTSLGDAVELGRDVFLERRATFDRVTSRRRPAVVLGEGVQVLTWCAFSVEDDALLSVGAGSVLAGALVMAAERVTIGREVVISYQVTISDSDFHPLDPALRRQDAVALSPTGDRSRRAPVDTAPVTIEDGVRIGAGAIVLKGVTIGAGAVIGAGTVVTRSVPAGATMAGNPARPVSEMQA